MAQLFKVYDSDGVYFVVATNVDNAISFIEKEGIDLEEIQEFDENSQIFDPETNSYIKASELEDLTNEETRWSIIIDSSTI